MRMLKRWRYVLMALVLIGMGDMAVAYVRSPGYRGAQAYARIQEGMTRDEAYAIIIEWGGYSVIRTGIDFWDERYYFGDRCCVGFNLQSGSDEAGAACVKEKFLSRPTFTEWVSDLVDSFKPETNVTEGAGFAVGTGVPGTYSSDPNERMQELLNDPDTQKQIRKEWLRFKELDNQTPSTAK